MSVRRMLPKQTAMTVGVVLVAGALLSLVFRGPRNAAAIWISGVVAIAVQLAAFSIGGMVGRSNLVARMGSGMLVRFLGLVLYALIVVLALKLPSAAALISLATFFFFSTLIEPLLIKS